MAEYIEREVLLAWFGGYKANDPHEYLSPKHIIDDIAEIPAADVAPVVHGRWMPCGFGKEIMCSVCRCELNDVWEYRHCPNCGARMDGE